MTTYGSTTLRFEVLGIPVAWARSRARFVEGQRPTFFKAPTQRANQKTIGQLAAYARGSVDIWEVPVELECIFFFPVAKSWAPWRRAQALAGQIMHTKKPDTDNLIKQVKDACTGILWRDDTFVVDTVGRKRYGETPRTVVVVRSLVRV